MIDREIYAGTTYLGTVCERDDGSFVAQIGEQIIESHATVKAATDALIEIARAGAR